MALVQEPDHHPHILHYAYRLVASSAKGIEVARLTKALHAGLNGSTGPIEKTVAAAQMLGLFTSDQEMVSLAGDLPRNLAREASTDDIAFRRLVRQRAFAAENVDSELGSRRGSSDFAQLAAWLTHAGIDQVPMDATGFERVLSTSFSAHLGTDSGPWPIINKEHWTVFVRWFQFLGLGWNAGTGLVADARVALRDELPAIFGKDRTLPVGEFVERSGVHLPHLDTGTYAGLVGKSLPGIDLQSLSMPLALAIEGLKADNQLEVRKAADADVRRGPFGDISHLELVA